MLNFDIPMISPVNSRALPEVHDVLASLYALKGRRTLSAQHDYLTSDTRYNDAVEVMCGARPALFGGDFSFVYHGADPASVQHCGPANITEPGHGIEAWDYAPEKVFCPEGEAEILDINLHASRMALVERCIQRHRQGQLITLMWHGPTPDCGDVSKDGDLWAHGGFSAASWQAVLTPGTVMHGYWLVQVDRIASYLKLLEEARIPVLWRPYHEMNGGWFWWGRRGKGAFGFPRLWNQLYERFTEHHQLHNLIWVWNPNAPRDTPGDEAETYAESFPGHDTVDILASDIYHNDYRDSHYTDLLALAEGKLIALGEVGHLPDPEWLAAHPEWSWIMPWGGLLFRFNSPERIRELYSGLQHAPFAGN